MSASPGLGLAAGDADTLAGAPLRPGSQGARDHMGATPYCWEGGMAQNGPEDGRKAEREMQSCTDS